MAFQNRTNIFRVLLLPLLIGASYYAWHSVPDVILRDGGSCNQGIVAVFAGLLNAASTLFNFIALIAFYVFGYSTFSKVFSVFSMLIWIFLSAILTMNYFMSGFIYILPLLIINTLILWSIIKGKNSKKTDTAQ